jgi:CheY-like chemotaxis protein
MTGNPVAEITALVVDDDELVRETLADVLLSNGVAVSKARNGNECLRMVQKQSFDVIVMDIIMPEKEGLETIATLRRQRSGAKIIAISGGGRTRNGDFLALARRFGANRALHKPVDPEFLISEIKSVVAEGRAA